MWNDLPVVLFVSGALLYVGVSLAVDPASAVRHLESCSHALQNFDRALHGLPPQRLIQPVRFTLSSTRRTVLRAAGLVLVTFALLYAIGVAFIR